MARTAYGKHSTQVDTATYPDDPSVPIGSDEWNASPSDSGMLGFSAETIASATSITPSNTVLNLSGSTDVATIAQGNTNEYDLLYVFTSGTVTLVHNTGNLQLISGANKDLSTTIPTILIRKGTDWVEYGGGGNVTGTVMSGHIIPDTNDTYDIGSASYKIRDLYVSDSSLWVGDNHKVDVQGGKMKFKKRKSSSVPAVITTGGGNEAGAKSHSGKGTLGAITLSEWVAYARSLGGSLADANPNDIFRSDQSDDWDTDEASITSEQASAITANTAKTGITSGQASAITANTAKTGITSGQASAITANTAKTGITTSQSNAITANTAKISLEDNSVTVAKLAHGTAGKLLGFNADTGVPEEQDAPSGSVGNTVVLKHNTTIGEHTVPTLEDHAGSSVGTGTGNTTYVALTDTTTTVPLVDTYYNTLWTSTANQADQDNSTSSQIYTVSGSSAYRDNGYATWDFGDVDGYAIRITQHINDGQNGVAQWFYSNDNSSWTEITSAVPTATKTQTDYAIGSFRYLKYYQNSASGWMTQHLYQVTRLRYGSTVDYTSRKMVDEDTGEYAVTSVEVNPWLSVGMLTSTLTSGVALWHESDTTETEIKIQTSPDNSTWTTQRTVLVSKLTAGQYNYIRFTPTTCKFIRIYGSSGASKKLAIGELHVKSGITDAVLLTDHEHLDISTTDTSLELDGTA